MSEPDGVPASASMLGRLSECEWANGRDVEPGALAEVRRVLADMPRQRELLIEYLHRVQDVFGHLTTEHMTALAEELCLSEAEVLEVARFYHHFDVVKEGEAPPPALTVRVCDGLPCEMAGANDLLQRLPDILGREVRVISASCIGRCAQAPAILVGQNALPHATVENIVAAVHAKQTGAVPLQYIGLEEYVGQGGYALLRQCVYGARDVESVLKSIQDCGLRGLGGSGFPAAVKWRIVRSAPAPRLMAVNINEGEPGTFKDRFYLERDPHRFIEGMLIAAWAVGVEAVYVYLRDEYHACRAMLEAEFAKLRLAPPHPGMPELILRRGAGSYICGEESAMIESIQGNRGLPRLRPPFPVEVGLFGRPTLVHNLETLYWVRDILEKGADQNWAEGAEGHKGLRSFSVSGRVKSPGVKIAPHGITAQQLIDEHCGGMLEGHTLYAYLPSGASGGIQPASLSQIPLGFGTASVIVLSDRDSALVAVRNLARFFERESCGLCTPCHIGTAKVRAMIEQSRWDVPSLQDLCTVMRDASICGLGTVAPSSIESVLKHFPQEVRP